MLLYFFELCLNTFQILDFASPKLQLTLVPFAGNDVQLKLIPTDCEYHVPAGHVKMVGCFHYLMLCFYELFW